MCWFLFAGFYCTLCGVFPMNISKPANALRGFPFVIVPTQNPHETVTSKLSDNILVFDLMSLLG